MSRIVAIVLVVAGWSLGVGATTVPERINYEGKLTTAAGAPVSGTQTLSFALYANPTGGSSLWGETQDVWVQDGVFSVTLGQVTPVTSAFMNVDQRWLGVTVIGESEMQPRQRITSAGYALNADTLDGQHAPAGSLVGTTDMQTLSNKSLASPIVQGQWDGWVIPTETWTFASSTTFTVGGDVTSKYQKGDRIRLKQGGAYKYFYLINVTYSSNSTVTLTAGNDFALTSATITDNYYSKIANPEGFPDYFTYTPTTGSFTAGNGVLTGQFSIQGRTCTFNCGLQMGSTTTYCNPCQLNFGSAPLGARVFPAAIKYPCSVILHDCGAAVYAAGCAVQPGGTGMTQICTGTGIGSTTSPFTWQWNNPCTDEIAVSGVYEYE